MSNKIVEDWVAKYGNNPEVDKIVNERVEYMNKKPHQRLLDGMPPHIAEKVDKMIGNMKEVYDLAMESWEGCDGCTEQDKHFFINGFMRGYNMGKPDKIKVTVKKDSPAADIIKAAKEEKQAFKEAVESGNNKQPELRYKDGTPMRKYNSPKLKAIEMENKQQTAVEWLVEMLIDNKYLIKDATHLFEQAKQMEKEQLENARPQIISNCVIKEIADDDIKRRIKKEYNYTHYEDRLWMVQGAVWYKEQLKKQQ